MRLVQMALQVGAGRGAVYAARVDQADREVGRAEQRMRHKNLDAVRQAELGMTAVVDLGPNVSLSQASGGLPKLGSYQTSRRSRRCCSIPRQYIDDEFAH